MTERSYPTMEDSCFGSDGKHCRRRHRAPVEAVWIRGTSGRPSGKIVVYSSAGTRFAGVRCPPLHEILRFGCAIEAENHECRRNVAVRSTQVRLRTTSINHPRVTY